MQAFQLFRSCSSSLSARSIARASVPVGRRAAMGTRYYSDDKAQASEGEETKRLEGESKETEEKPAPPSPEAALTEKLAQKEREVTDLTGRLRYLQADFLNLQRNAAKEKEQTRDFAISRFASDLLETVDVLAIALKSVPPSVISSASSSSSPSPPPSNSSNSSEPSEKSAEVYLNELHTGVEMTHRLLMQTLFKYGVKPFDPTGDKFDPNRHEALFQTPVPDKEPGTVFNCQKTGYMIKDRVLRAAQVGVVQEQQS
ncbi:GrpE-domain-containing protein [Sparassis latifolia]|uniref:GrpE protein homolog, mitochondrial n=1 Tax=Sparassis crispa TaxID=139825 RepID=A0A401GIT4_9APHY|nr:GrpE protein homolog, mitochondrial [Sparassis crispa]GBE82082.1 GrpE protein homolog, mitochondrial [Sparassis crispa]